jgi:hypothetical protein
MEVPPIHDGQMLLEKHQSSDVKKPSIELGLEQDCLSKHFIQSKTLATNPGLVKKVVRLVYELEPVIAMLDEARALLGLKGIEGLKYWGRGFS